jgi:hypothetical protein
MYLQWLYSQKVAIKYHTSTQTNGNVSEEVDPGMLINTYVLGEKLMDVVYQNVVMEALIQCINNGTPYPSDDDIRFTY